MDRKQSTDGGRDTRNRRARKVRWTVQGRGKRGGARVVYFNLLDDGQIVLLMVYVKAECENVARETVKGAKHGFEND